MRERHAKTVREMCRMEQKTFVQMFQKMKALESQSAKRFRFEWQDCWPCLADDTAQTSFDSHYIYHTAWAARILARTKPPMHIDLSSSLYFSAIVSAFVPIQFYDYRLAPIELSGLSSNRADLLNLPFENDSIPSLSCMHVVEHIGLGRYGDPLNYNGDLLACAELSRVVLKGGSLLFVVPIGFPRICYNAHRIYSLSQIKEMFAAFSIKEFALIPDNFLQGIIANPPEDFVNRQKYGCGCFWLEKQG